MSKKATLKALVNGVIEELMVKTNIEQVYLDDNNTLASKLADMIVAINLRAKKEDVTAQIDALRQEMLGDVPVEAYDTFTELAAYIEQHEDVSEALTAAIGQKADKSVVDELTSVVDTKADKSVVDELTSVVDTKADKSVVDDILVTLSTLGSLATKSSVSEDDLDEELRNKINETADATVTQEEVNAWNAKTKLYIDENKPEAITSNDLWFHTIV